MNKDKSKLMDCNLLEGKRLDTDGNTTVVHNNSMQKRDFHKRELLQRPVRKLKPHGLEME